jgi:hypothetical protein
VKKDFFSMKRECVFNVQQSKSYIVNGKTYHSFEDIPALERKLLLESGLLSEDCNLNGIPDFLEATTKTWVTKLYTKRTRSVETKIVNLKDGISIPEMSLKSQILLLRSLPIITSCLFMCLFLGWALSNKMNGPKGGLILFGILIAISSFMSVITCNEELKSVRATGYRLLIMKYGGNKFATWLSILNIFLYAFCFLVLMYYLRNIS